jgi:hypothetical protein
LNDRPERPSYYGRMNDVDLLGLFRDLNRQQLLDLLADIEARRRAVKVMLRAVQARDRVNRRQQATREAVRRG